MAGRGLLGPEPEVVAQALLGAHPVGPGRDPDELDERLLVAGAQARRTRPRREGAAGAPGRGRHTGVRTGWCVRRS